MQIKEEEEEEEEVVSKRAAIFVRVEVGISRTSAHET